MIKNISIRNFKSIKQLDFKAKRVNVFIGEPNTGKSNILEALGMFSLIHSKEGDVPIRYQEVSNLFYDDEMYTSEVTVRADPYSYKINSSQLNAVLTQENKETGLSEEKELFDFYFEGKKPTVRTTRKEAISFPIKYYQFKVLDTYGDSVSGFLNPPYGSNLYEILKTSKALKSMIAEILKEKDYRLVLRQKGKEIEVTKEVDDIQYAYPYQNLSDTLQRIVFYLAIIETNKNSTILLEEPESHIFPFYTNRIAEQIALDVSNQYFLVTHNPYFLTTITEKTKPEDLAIFVTYLEDYQTKLIQLDSSDISELLNMDSAVFFNLDKFTEREGVH